MIRETVLYYSPEKTEKVRRIKSVLVRLGIRIRNITPEQTGEQVGTLAGLENFAGKKEKTELTAERESKEKSERTEQPGSSGAGQISENAEEARREASVRADASDDRPAIPEEMLVLHQFTNARLDQLLRELRRANASVALKAVLTPTNAAWTFAELYTEIRKEHERMTGQSLS